MCLPCHRLQQLNTISQHSNIRGIPREKETQPGFHSDVVTRPLSAFLWLAMMGCHALWAHGELAAVDLIDLPKNRSRSKRFLHPGTQLGTGNLNSGNILGTSWELGTWEFIARNGLLGGHLGNQNHWIYWYYIQACLVMNTGNTGFLS